MLLWCELQIDADPDEVYTVLVDPSKCRPCWDTSSSDDSAAVNSSCHALSGRPTYILHGILAAAASIDVLPGAVWQH